MLLQCSLFFGQKFEIIQIFFSFFSQQSPSVKVLIMSRYASFSNSAKNVCISFLQCLYGCESESEKINN